jgi:predicted S18 family serine protease
MNLFILTGWTLERYLRDTTLDEKFTATELSTVKDQLAVVEQATKIKDDRITQLENTLAGLKSSVAMISEVLSRKPTIDEVEASLDRKKRTVSHTASSARPPTF